jgi:sister chromatid cohesion protein DCC1
MTMSDIAKDVPFSDGEIQQAWTQICAFQDGRKSFRPTAAVLLSLWKAIVAASVAENFDLGSSFLADDLWALVKDEEYPRGMFNAIMHRVAERDTMEIDSGSKCTGQNNFQILAFVRRVAKII